MTEKRKGARSLRARARAAGGRLALAVAATALAASSLFSLASPAIASADTDAKAFRTQVHTFPNGNQGSIEESQDGNVAYCNNLGQWGPGDKDLNYTTYDAGWEYITGPKAAIIAHGYPYTCTIAGTTYEWLEARGITNVAIWMVNGQVGDDGKYTTIDGKASQLPERWLAPARALVNAATSGEIVGPENVFRLYHRPTNVGYTMQEIVWVPINGGSITIHKSSSDANVSASWSAYSLEGAKYAVYIDAACTGKYCEISTDGSGNATTPVLAPGSFWVKELDASKGYRLDSNTYKVDVPSGGTAELNVTEVPKTGAVSIQKSSSNPSLSGTSSCYSLEGAEYTLYTDAACTDSDGKLVLDKNGYAKVSGLPIITHYVKETKAGKGYALDTAVYKVDVKADETTAVNGKDGVKDAPQNDPASIVVQKVDLETGKASPLGAGTLAGAEFTVKFYEGYYTKDSLPAKATRTWVLKTDEKGRTGLRQAKNAPDTYFVTGDAFYTDSNGNYTFPLGTVTVQETKAPTGYLLTDGELKVQNVTSDGTLETVRTFVEPDEDNPTVTEQIKRGDLRLVKRSEDQELLAGVPWRITSKTTGESHVIVTDANGNIDTSIERGTVNANDAAVAGDGTVDESKLDAANGVWFAGKKGGEIKQTDKGALPYDTYELQELRCSANEGMKLAKVTATVSSDGRTVDLGTVTDIQPTIQTTAADREMGGHTGTPGTSTVIQDTVELGDLSKGHTYTVKGQIADTETGEVYAEAEDTFTATAKTAKRKIDFAFDSSALAGRTVTVLERLYEDGDLLASHEDVDDADQQVSFPEIRTKASASGTASGMALAEAGCKLTDTVSYKGLEAGCRYVLETSLVDAETGEAIEGGAATTELVPEETSGEAKVEVEIDASGLAGRSVVFFETLKRDGATVAKHQDREDTDQTVRFPKVGTQARDAKTGISEGLAEEGATIVDTVSYENVEPGMSYTVTGTLRDPETGEALKDADGTEIRATESFVPEAESGTVDVTFTFDATAIAGKSTVAYESLAVDGAVVAKHEDKDDKGQTVAYPKIGTQAAGEDGSQTVDASDGKVKVVDTVSYEGLTAGEAYTITGTLMDKATGDPIKVGDDTVTASAELKPKKSSGTAKVTFEFDASALGGVDAVAFEELSVEGKLVAQHKDIDDAKQTVYLRPSIATNASTRDGNELTAGKDAEIVDTVSLKGLQPGKSYTLTATPMDKDSKSAIAISMSATEGDDPAEAGAETADGASWSVSTGTLEDKDALAAFKVLKEHKDEVAVSEDGESLSVTVDGSTYALAKVEKIWTIKVTDAEGKETASYKLPDAEVKISRADGSTDESAETEQATDLPDGLSAYEVLDNGKVRFTPTATEVEVEVPVSIEGGNVTEGDIVMFESLARDSDGTEIAKHEDLNDADQTVHVKAAPKSEEKKGGSPASNLAQTGAAAAGILFVIAAALFAASRWTDSKDDDGPAPIVLK